MVLLCCIGIAGCESFPVVKVSVWESSSETATSFEETPPDHAVASVPWPPIPNAIVVVTRPGRYPDDPIELAATIQDDPQIGRHAYLPIGADVAVAMRTEADGTADYSELRLWPFKTSQCVFTVWAQGFKAQQVTVEFGAGNYLLVVPLQRNETR
jgi:hypothetical protein